MERETMSSFQIYLYMGIMVITGSINTIANKLMQQTESLGILFERHQKFITFAMFIGEFFCLALYYILKKTQKTMPNPDKMEKILPSNTDSQEEEKKEELPQQEEKVNEAKIYYFFLPAICDFFASTIMSISLTYVATSVYQMFRGTIILSTALASFLFLKTRFFRFHYLGIGIVFLGLATVGINSIVISDKGAGLSPVAGITLVIVAQIFATAMFIVEEKLLKQFDTPALKVVGFEGMWGTITYILVMIISYFIECNNWSEVLKTNLCSLNEKGEYRFEDILFAFRQIGASVQLICFFLLYIISIAFFNFAGLSITKFVSSTARTIVDTLRTIVIWFFFLVMPFVPESTKETFYPLQLVGFIIVVLGSIIYKAILIIPFWGFDIGTPKTKKNVYDDKKEDPAVVNNKDTEEN